MGWENLLQPDEMVIVVPWVGGRDVRLGPRKWSIQGRRPFEYGWHRFACLARQATWVLSADPAPEILQEVVKGYLAGDRIVPDDAKVVFEPSQLAAKCERVYCLEPGLDRFARVSAGRACDAGPLIFRSMEMPLGPESDVNMAFLNKETSVQHLPGVIPALDATFRLENWHRAEVERRRVEVERQRKEEEERAAREQRRQELVEELGDGVGRRRMAQVDFQEAARAALAVGGAEYLEHKASTWNPREMIVTFRFERRVMQCTCDRSTLRIIDSGICLTNEDTGEKGDDRFVLESLPSVIAEASRSGRLHVYRRMD